MAIFTFAISTSPQTLLNRSLDVCSINIQVGNILLTQQVFTLTAGGVRIIDNQASPYSSIFRMDNTTLVDPTPGGQGEGYFVVSDGLGGWVYTGGPLVGQAFVGSPVGLYTFLITLIGTGVVLGAYITKTVSNLDTIGYYNT